MSALRVSLWAAIFAVFVTCFVALREGEDQTVVVLADPVEVEEEGVLDDASGKLAREELGGEVGPLREVRGDAIGWPTDDQERAFGQLFSSIEGKRNQWGEPALSDGSLYRFRSEIGVGGESVVRAANPLHVLELAADASGVRVARSGWFGANGEGSGSGENLLNVRMQGVAQGMSDVSLLGGEYAVESGRMQRLHGSGILEWWENGPAGLEHGFVVGEPLDRETPEAEMWFSLKLESPLEPVFDSQRQEIVFLDEVGRRAMTYGQLAVWDDEGKAVPAWLEAESAAIGVSSEKGLLVSLVVDVGDAAFPLVVDPTVRSQLLVDICSDANVEPEGAAVLGNSILFRGLSDSTGTEPWISDGTAEGTRLLRDIYAGRGGSFPHDFRAVGEYVYFQASSPEYGRELWRTDGTREGTILLRDLYEGAEGSDVLYFSELQGLLFFTAYGTSDGEEANRHLWCTDGTPEGTWIVRDGLMGESLNVGTASAAMDDSLYVWAYTGEGAGRISDLWRISMDGEVVSVSRVGLDKTIGTFVGMKAWRGRLLFAAGVYGGQAFEGISLWSSDGTLEGTETLVEVDLWDFGQTWSVWGEVGDKFLFKGSDSEWGDELWVTDGTGEGTRLLRDISPGSQGSDPKEIVTLGSKAFFVAGERGDGGGTGEELWMTDGTEEGTVLVADLYAGLDGSGPNQLTVAGDRLYFAALGHDGTEGAGMELWSVDEAGALVSHSLFEGEIGSDPERLVGVGDTLYFTAQSKVNGEVSGRQIWTSVGGSVQRLDTDYPELERASISSVFFERGDGGSYLFLSQTGSGNSLWLRDASDGSLSAVSRVSMLDYSTGHPLSLGRLGEDLIFKATSLSEGEELWKTDGTAGGTVLLKDIYQGQLGSFPKSSVVLGDLILFSAESYDGASEYGTELWKTDGTTQGTQMVKDIYVGKRGSSPAIAIVWNGVAYLSAGSESSGQELWRSDGTEVGTYMVKEINEGEDGSDVWDFAVMGDWLYFSAESSRGDRELWKTDGTESGTQLVKDILPGEEGSYPDELFVMGDTLFFRARTELGTELWKSDGTAEGTVQVKDIALGSEDSWPTYFTEFGGELYFSAAGYDGESRTGTELWKSDGTGEATVLVKDIWSGSGDSIPYGFIEYDGVLFFAGRGSDGEADDGHELWRTDGTSEGTYRVSDLFVGQFGGSAPQDFFVANDILFFTAIGDDGVFRTDRELWMTDGTDEGTKLVEDLLYGYGDSRFRLMDQRGDLLYFGGENWHSNIEIRVLDLSPEVDPPVPNIEYTAAGEAGFQFRFFAEADYRYKVQMARSLSSGSGEWEEIDTVGVEESQLFEYLDAEWSEGDERFYRINALWPLLDLTVVGP